MAQWPASLPQSPLLEGFSDTPQDTVIRSGFIGGDKQRNRYTAAVHNVTENYLMTPAQFQTFLEFFRDTLKNGSLTFDKEDPVEGGFRTYQMVAPYQAPRAGLHYRVQLTMEKLP